MVKKEKPIDRLHKSCGEALEVEEAVRLHMDCPACHGGGGAPMHPEQPCCDCGFTMHDSLGVEQVMDKLRRKPQTG